MERIIDSTNQNDVNKEIDRLKKQERLYSNRKEEILRIPNYEEGKGLPIGNMTSQFLSIFYLNRLDHKIIHEFHVKHYVRYMDDFLLIHHSKEHLKWCLKEIECILKRDYKLNLNRNKTRIYSSNGGFEFLGYRFRIWNHKTIMTLRRESIMRIKKRVKEVNYLYRCNRISFEKCFSSMNNYLYTYKGSKRKINDMIEKYWFQGK